MTTGPFLPLAIATGGLSAFGAWEQSQATKSAANYQAAVARNNEIIAKQNAGYASQAGEAAAEREGLKNRAQEGSIKANQAAKGLDVNTGSNVDVQQSQAEIDALNRQTVAHEAALKIYGYKNQATQFGAQEDLYKNEAAGADTAAVLNTVSSLLSSASDLPFKFNWMQGGGTDQYEPETVDVTPDVYGNF